MKYTATIAALAAVSSAATVTLKTTPCLQDYPLEEWTIDTNKLVVHDLQTVCGIKILNATGVSASSLTCLAYKDKAGTQPGSAYFSLSDPAAIATNPVQEAAVRCDENGKPPMSNGNNATAVGTVTSVTFVTLPTGTAGTTANTAASSGSIPTPSGNSTSPSATGTPTQPSVAPTNTDVPGAASMVSLSMGAVVAGLMAFLL
ncbi:hypothetical protein BDV96DRAFT_604832 [Lophiotrema nucula]|uniref:GPI anchored cell wall protein n=1 Tax=Lophiotrema nucula TaxID=690887 RepID=A0A6A5YR59_9PLEO|nr:hypothetical protein BDV96DRAFT_604832 [Lophiotrema nucula]